MRNQNITKGASVYFDIGRGTQSGTIIDLRPCVTNGRQHAIVELDHQLPGILQSVPIDQLSMTKEVPNSVFMSGSVDTPSQHHINRHYSEPA
jgi:hypothetical protein